MQRGTDFDAWSDPLLRMGRTAKILAPSGLPEALVERFLSVWGQVPLAELPQSCLFELVKSESTALGSAPAVTETARRVEQARLAGRYARVSTSGELVGEGLVAAETLATVKGLRWTLLQASQASFDAPSACFILCVGYEVMALVGGTLAIHYVDVRNRTAPSAFEERQREAWNDGHLLKVFGEQDLPKRARLGVWFLPDHYLLKPRPEGLIEERLHLFLSARLVGFRQIQQQRVWEDKGQLDLFVETSDGYQYIVELKWLGRSVQKKHEHTAAAELEKGLPSWRNKYVTVMDSADVSDALQQLAAYMRSRVADVGYLAVYDCREPSRHCALTHDGSVFNAVFHRLFDVKVHPEAPSGI
jgi:hypothetical protein